jgi:ubiquinone/menaquinone biosynthesis C-methylase UbiE
MPKSDSTQFVIDLWKSKHSSDIGYYEKAESDEWLRGFWVPSSRFFRLFQRLDLSSVLDLACGQGRHAAQFVDRAGHVTLFDTSPVAIEACKSRFRGRTNVTYILSPTGRDLREIPDASLTAVMSYDAMVHFEMECVFGYLTEIHRTLRTGGRALLHHSIYDKNPGANLQANPDWRNFMSEPAFREAALRTGFEIESLETFSWSRDDVTDALTLLVRT